MAVAPIMNIRAWGSSGSYTDFIPYIAEGGLKWGYNSIDAPNSGRDTQDGLMHRAMVAVKIRLDITCRPLTQEEATIVLQVLNHEWLQVQYFDIGQGAVVTKKMYTNNIPATFIIQDGTRQLWGGIAFPLIEQ